MPKPRKPYQPADLHDLEQLRGHFRHLLSQARIHEAEGDDRAGQIRRQIEGEIRALEQRLEAATSGANSHSHKRLRQGAEHG